MLQAHVFFTITNSTVTVPQAVGLVTLATVTLCAASLLITRVRCGLASLLDQGSRRDLDQARITLEQRIIEHEAEAAMATELYALLAEHATDMVSTHHPDGRFAYATATWTEFLGVPMSEIAGHIPTEFAHPDDLAVIAANHERGLRTPGVITTVWRCRRRDPLNPSGAPIYAWVETKTRPVRETTSGRVQTFVCATRDVTERRELDQRLARSEARLRAALDGSFDAFFAMDAVRDPEGRVVDFVYAELNTRAEAMLGRPRTDVVGRRMLELYPRTAKTHLTRMAQVIETQSPLEDEIELNLHGSTRWFHHQIIPLGDGVAVTTRDVTDRKHSEEELRAMTLVDDLTGLYNRRGFRMLAEQHFRLTKRGGPISLLVSFDLNDFKNVNDFYGHAEGDAALRRFADVLRQAFRDSDIIARFGGDEFSVLALDCGEFREQIVERVEAILAKNNATAGRPYDISISLGTSRFDPFSPTSLDALMAEADANLYESKRALRSG